MVSSNFHVTMLPVNYRFLRSTGGELAVFQMLFLKYASRTCERVWIDGLYSFKFIPLFIRVVRHVNVTVGYLEIRKIITLSLS